MVAGAKGSLPHLLCLCICAARTFRSGVADSDGAEPDMTMVTQGLKNRASAYIAVGQLESVACTSKARLIESGSFMWTANGQDLNKLSEWSTLQFGNGMLMVRLADGNGDRTGSSQTMLPSATYQCLIKDSDGQVMLGHPRKVSAAAAAKLRAVARSTDGSLPSNGSVNAGTTAVLHCVMEGRWSPNPNRFRWYKNSKLLAEVSRIAILPTGVVLIPNVTLEDSGAYQCSAAVEQFNRTVTPWILSPVIQIQVVDPQPTIGHHGMRVIQAPPRHVAALEGDTIVVPCIVERSGIAFTTWWGGKGRSNDCSGPEVKYLWIENVTAADSGYYYCAICRHLEDTQPTVLNVTRLDIQGAPVLLGKAFVRTEAAATEHILMSCVSSASRTEQSRNNVTWFKNGIPVKPGGSVKLTSTWELSLTSFDGSHEGCYQCFVENAAGIASRTFCIVLEKPEPLYMSEMVSVLPAACHADSSLTVIWDIHFDDIRKVVASTIEYKPAVQSGDAHRPMEKVIPPAECVRRCYGLTVAGVGLGSDLGRSRSAFRRCARCQAVLDELLPATTYTLRLRVFDGSGSRGYSPAVNVTTAPRLRLQSVQTKVYGSSAILLDWSQSPNSSAAGTYTIIWRQQSFSDLSLVSRLASGVEQPYYLVKGVKPGDIYQFSVVVEPYLANCSDTPWVSVAVPPIPAYARQSPTLSVIGYNSTAVVASWSLNSSSLARGTADEVMLYYETGSRQYGPFIYSGTSGSRLIDLAEDGWCEVTAVTRSAGASAVATVSYEKGPACADVVAATDLRAEWLNGTAAAFSWSARSRCCAAQLVAVYRAKSGRGPFETTAPLPCDANRVVVHNLQQLLLYEWMVLTTRKGAVAPTAASEPADYGHSKVPMARNLTVAIHLLPDNRNNYGDSVAVELRWMKPSTVETLAAVDYYIVHIVRVDYIDPKKHRVFHVNDTSLKLSYLEPGQRYTVSVIAASGSTSLSAPLQAMVKVPCLLADNCSNISGKAKGGESNVTSLGDRGATVDDKRAGVLSGSLLAAFFMMSTVVGLVALKKSCGRRPRSTALAFAPAPLIEKSVGGRCASTSYVEAEQVCLSMEWKEQFRRDSSPPDSGVVETSSMQSTST